MSEAERMPMPKTRSDFEHCLMTAFVAGCHHGYTIEHTCNVSRQEQLGAEFWTGRITREEFEKCMREICDY